MAYLPEPVGFHVSSWGEGPVWWQDHLLHVDIEGHAVVRYEPTRNEATVWDVGERVGCVVPRARGGWVIAGDNGVSFFDPASGTKVPVADPEPDRKPDNRFNDGKCDPAGRFWAGTISTVKRTGDARLYRIDPDLRVSERFGPVTNSNGLGWSPAGDTMFYIDTPRKQVLAFDYELATGNITDPRPVVDTAALGIEGSPDGMAVDSAGRIWVAMCHGGCVSCFEPGTGREVERIVFPCIETTAPAFGGPDGTTLYVTTGIKHGLDEPLAGRLFAVELPVKGLPAHAFAG